MTSIFERYAERLALHGLTRTGEASGAELQAAIRDFDHAVRRGEGHGFEVTPFERCDGLATAVGIGDRELWVKDETGNVSGSHKARHLFGVALSHHLTGALRDGSRYAIASCGNAALAAAVVARALGRPLDVYVPTWANQAVVDRITELDGRVVRCDRRPGMTGDPAHHAFLAAIRDGAVPFSCQGTETPDTIDGGRTLAWEMVDALIERDGSAPPRLDRVFVQVGGGALATAVVTGLAGSVARGHLQELPIVHAVQSEGCHPLVRAWDRLIAELTDGFEPQTNAARAASAASFGRMESALLRTVTRGLREHPQHYMKVWESEPASYASGILDDITYDWVEVIEAMLETAGWPLVSTEEDLRVAHRLAHMHTGINVCPTGSAGLGGLISLLGSPHGEGATRIGPGERIAVLFTGRMRPGDPDPLAASA